MKDFISDWERCAVLELNAEYKRLLCERHLDLAPATIELTDSTSFWGRWDPELRTIFVSRTLILNHSWFHVIGILRHEAAHQVVDELFSPLTNFLNHNQRIHNDTFRKA